MRENVTCKQIGDKWYDVFVREDGSITFREIFNLWPYWSERRRK